MSWVSLLLTFSKFLNFSELLFCKVRKKMVHLTSLVVRSMNYVSLQCVSQSAESSAGHAICFPFLGPQSELQMGMEVLSPSGQEVWIPVPATVVPVTSLSHFLSHCLLVSEHRKLRSSGTKPASKHRSILHASFKTGVGGLGKSRPAFSPPQWKAFPHSSHPLPSFTGSYIPVCFCYTMNRSDKDPLGERAQEREKRLGEAEANR